MTREKAIEIIERVDICANAAETARDMAIAALKEPEIVRCKDCKWYCIAPIDNVPYCCHESGYCGEYMGGLFFCACGERKDNEELQ